MIRIARRILLAAIAATLALPGTAFALSYKTGTYRAGNPATGAGVRMKISHGSFSVEVIRYHETCSYGSHTGVDYFKFIHGSNASLTGRINRSGQFSGSYHQSTGTVTVRGRVQGSSATVTSTEHGPYNPASTVQPNNCHGSHAFHATR